MNNDSLTVINCYNKIYLLCSFISVIPRRLSFYFLSFREHPVLSIFIGRCLHDLLRWNCVPKRRHITFIRRGITPSKNKQVQSTTVLLKM